MTRKEKGELTYGKGIEVKEKKKIKRGKGPEGDMSMSWWGLEMESSWTLMVMLPPVPETHPRE